MNLKDLLCENLNANIHEAETSGLSYNGPDITDPKAIVRYLTSSFAIDSDNIRVNEDGTTDVLEELDFDGMHFKKGKLPIKFGIIEGNFYAGDCNLNSFENFPRIVEGNVSLTDNRFTSLVGSPERIGGALFLGDNKLLSSLEGISPELGGLNIRDCEKLTSLHNIHNQIKKFNYTHNSNSTARPQSEGSIFIGSVKTNKLSSSVLGIFLIDGVSVVRAGIGTNESSRASYGPWEIINKHLLAGGANKDSMFDCQEELYEAGFKEFAKL